MPYVNHVAVPVDDVDRAVAFYADWFDARVVPSPRFPVPVAWMLLGKIQLHLVQHPGKASTAYHFSIGFDDRDEFEALYRRAEIENKLDRVTFQHHIFEMPDGAAQLYIRDTADNLVECAYPVFADLDPQIFAVRRRWSDLVGQSTWNMRSSLFMPEQSGLALEPSEPSAS